MNLDMAPCPHITAQSGSQYGSMFTYYLTHAAISHSVIYMDQDIALCLHIITHMDMGMAPWIWILSHPDPCK